MTDTGYLLVYRITFGFMGVTGFLSMWLANVPTTAMMIPIAAAVLTALNDHRMLVRELRRKKRCTTFHSLYPCLLVLYSFLSVFYRDYRTE